MSETVIEEPVAETPEPKVTVTVTINLDSDVVALLKAAAEIQKLPLDKFLAEYAERSIKDEIDLDLQEQKETPLINWDLVRKATLGYE